MQRISFFLGVLLTIAFIGVSCDKEEPQYDTPQISVVGESLIDLKPGSTVNVKLQLNGDGGAKSVVVTKNGGFLKEFTVPPTSTEFIYTTEPLEKGLAEGDEVTYGFVLSNLNNVDSQEAPFTIKVALYDKVTIGTTELYSLAIGVDGIVASGTETKLITGRDYYLPHYLTFEPGSKLTIEEGVHLYMNADADPAALAGIDIQGEAAVMGTATAPIVLTSSNVLKADKTPAPGDWAEFKISGDGASSNNGTVNYLRLEYGGNRMFRLSNVGSATSISHVQAFKSAGEGVMVTDGNVNLKYIVATDCEGGSYRLGDKYQGKMQFLISVNSIYFKDNDDFTIREDAAPVIANATVLGAGADLTSNTHGMRFRANAAPKVYNTIIAGFPRRGLRAGDNVTITDMNGAAVFAYSHVFNVPRDPYREKATAFASGFHNSEAEIPGIGVAAFVPSAVQASAFNPSSLGSFFESAPFVGAVKDAAGDWTKGWVKNPDGKVR
ncbi:MAG TPA: hypothetical protein GXZ56_07255 [Bacteroidales bacterium]|jgi:hypothetical protein|nr:hypothetical protein [Bacteroidales bacterium]